MTQPEFYKQVLEKIDDLNNQLEDMKPSSVDSMTGYSLIDVELLKVDALMQIAKALREKK